MNRQKFELILTDVCAELTLKAVSGGRFTNSETFENSVRAAIFAKVNRDMTKCESPHPYNFPDIVLGQFGVEVKFTTGDSWRSVANSVFEGFRDESVDHIYVIYGKMGGAPEVRWRLYEDSVMHVRTSHVPRFEIDLNAKRSLFSVFGITYAEFSALSEESRMTYIRQYARKRLKPGERLWWLDNVPDGDHSISMQVRLFSNLENSEKLRMRAEASLLCPQIVGSSRNRTKYVDPILFLLTYHGILASRDAFSAGSAAGPERGGIYVQRALKRIEKEMRAAAAYMAGSLFEEYWGFNVKPHERVVTWLSLADGHAGKASPPWKPSAVLFRDD